jgi:two-component system sensor histidine kinase KdpD
MLRQSEEFKSTVLDALAHELKTPLTSLKASVSALRNDAAVAAPQAELLTIMEEETDRLNRLISEILQMARLDAGKLRLNRKAVAVERLIGPVVDSAQRSMDGRVIEAHLSPGVAAVSADEELAQTVLRHLLDNAAKYSAPGKPILVRAEAAANQMRVSVSDSGPGLQEDELAHVFERHFRGARTRDAVPGLGIGLAIARDIVLAHGGRIWAESTPGAGTTFTFTLPIATEPPR